MEKDFQTIQKIAFLTGCFLNYVDDLENNTMFKHEFKQKTNSYSNFLRKFEEQLLNVKDETEKLELAEQLHNSYLAIDNLVNVQFSLKNDSQRDYFNEEINKVVDKFNLNK